MKQPIERKAAQPGSRGGDGNGTITARNYPRRGAGARPNPEPWRPVRIGDLVDKALKNILRDGVQS